MVHLYSFIHSTIDHHIHYHDLRQPRDPVFIYRGHRKAVSYVKFMNSTQFVSAYVHHSIQRLISLQQILSSWIINIIFFFNSSTDSSLRLWDANKQSCVRTYTGHTNEKNFVGLTTSADWISCGSEDNAVYTYYKSLSQPVIKFNFGSIDMVTVSILWYWIIYRWIPFMACIAYHSHI